MRGHSLFWEVIPRNAKWGVGKTKMLCHTPPPTEKQRYGIEQDSAMENRG